MVRYNSYSWKFGNKSESSNFFLFAGGASHDLQAAAAAGNYGALHNNLPPALNSYPRPPLQVGYDPHTQMRAPVVPGLGGCPGGKP